MKPGKSHTSLLYLLAFLMCVIVPGTLPAQSASGNGLKTCTTNPNYFCDSNGNVVYLTGSHYWMVFLDGGKSYPPPVFDYVGYLSTLQAWGHNFFILWTWESPFAKETLHNYSGINGSFPFYRSPMMFPRPGPGTAADGLPKFDVSTFNQAYFDRMRQHVIDAGNAGMYVAIQLFEGTSVATQTGQVGFDCWSYHPLNVNNNINGINGDPNSTGQGYAVHQNSIPPIETIQENYVKKVIDTINNLPNVLFEICNESNNDSATIAWQEHMISVIQTYEAGKPYQHPVGFTIPYPDPTGLNSTLFSSAAAWISPNIETGKDYKSNPPGNTGVKVVLNDTDHLWGSGGTEAWAWQSFTRGLNPIFMDGYWDPNPGYPFAPPVGGSWKTSAFTSLRHNLGWIRYYGNRMNLAAMTPENSLASTGYCLARTLSFWYTNPAVVLLLSICPRRRG